MASKSIDEWEADYFRAIENRDTGRADKIASGLGYTPQLSEGETLQAMGQGFGQGLLFGFADEAAAGLSAGLSSLLRSDEEMAEIEAAGIDTSYEGTLGRTRARDRRLQESPLYTAAEFGGAVAAPGGLFASTARAASPLGRAALAGIEGAVGGGLAGAGYSEADDPTGDAAIGAGIGGVLSGTLPFAAPRVIRAVGEVFDRATQGPMARAEGRVGEELIGAGMDSGADVAARMAELGPEAVLADVAPGAAIQAVSRAGAGDLVESLAERQRGAPGRALQAIEGATGEPASGYGSRLQQLTDDAILAGDDYQALQSMPVARETFDAFLNAESTSMRAAVNDALDSWNTKVALGEVAPFSLTDEFIPLGFIDDLKKSFDAVGMGPMGVGTGPKGAAAGAARRAAKQLRSAADDAIEEYAPVRDRYRGIMQRLGALGGQPGERGGRQLFQTSNPSALDELAEGVSGMDPAALGDFRMGAAKSAEDLLAQRATKSGDVGNIFRPEVEGGRMGRALDIAATSPGAASSARSALEAESTFNTTMNRLSGGSQTQPRQAAVARGGIANMIADQLFPAGLTRETAESMRDLVGRGQLSISDLERMIERGRRAGVLEVEPETVASWLRFVNAGTRTGIANQER